MPTYKITVEGIFMVEAVNAFHAQMIAAQRLNGAVRMDIRTQKITMTTAPVIPEEPEGRDTWAHASPHFLEGQRCCCNCERCTNPDNNGRCWCRDCTDQDHLHYRRYGD